MAKSKVQLIDGLIQEVSKFSMTDDNSLSIAQEFISDKADTYRATILKTHSNSKGNLDSCYQIVNCLKPVCLGVECVVSGITLKSDTDIWEVEIPELLDIERSIKYFGSFDMQNAFTRTGLVSMARGNNRWGRKRNQYAKIGNKLYYKGSSSAIQLSLIGIFSSPSGVCGFNDTDPYPLPKSLEGQLELIIKKDLFEMLRIPLDVLSDAQDVMPAQTQK